ncbi:hypothetical protein [Leeuwenhoekiella marinoflava]|uniref:DUF4468 domain-containing protein n=2 Tax=Leeuwenhoekiella marinoflava TaxID=988 RepID=A0A4Q0PNJ2_9FLAO|nr:hypothetical protein [Leeuwenhoekiella marinoflava]RXG32011.1 hypothetical protein DSL99_1314 [Leeuwenhoekiella marinoflava]SHE94910.1 hypothetical protein SAMN02745246_01371 [Leeuwenhoekiella marinoflava DSM 3653]
MRKIFIILFFIALSGTAQTIKLNPDTNIYEVVVIDSLTKPVPDRILEFKKQMDLLSYADISSTDSSVSGESYFTKKIMGSAMEVHFNAIVQFKENKYRITLNKFYVNDVRYGQYTFEDMKSGNRKRWIKLVDEKAPEIIDQLKFVDNW